MVKLIIPKIKPGVAPGTSLDVTPEALPTEIKVLVYDATELLVYTLDDLLNHRVVQKQDQVLWVQVTGLKDIGMIQSIAQHFSFHPLTIEDTISGYQRAKVDNYPGYQFIVTKYIELGKENELQRQQVSLFLGQNFVVSFLEKPCALLSYFEKNLTNNTSRLRMKSCDYLVYEILDFITDSIFPVMSLNNDRLDNFESIIMEASSETVMREVQLFKRELRYLRQVLWANRDMLSALMRNELELMHEYTLIYMRDCYDHAVRLMDILESLRESAVSLVDVYLSSVANKLGQVMKVLTGISIIFMPPTFLAAVWGMNFKHMPELDWTHGYLLAWIIMIISAILPSLYFWRKGWLRSREDGKL